MDPKIRKVLAHFRKVDPILYSAAEGVDLKVITPREDGDYFYSLCNEIIGQQLAMGASSTIFNRFKKLFPGEKITPKETTFLSEDQLRTSGMSGSKARYIRDLAQKVVDRTLNLNRLDSLSDSEVIKTLTALKGIGPWTAEMFLMFTLGREDVFSYGDLVIRKNMTNLYSLKEDIKQGKMENMAKKWSPYRTYACLILWNNK